MIHKEVTGVAIAVVLFCCLYFLFEYMRVRANRFGKSDFKFLYVDNLACQFLIHLYLFILLWFLNEHLAVVTVNTMQIQQKRMTFAVKPMLTSMVLQKISD